MRNKHFIIAARNRFDSLCNKIPLITIAFLQVCLVCVCVVLPKAYSSTAKMLSVYGWMDQSHNVVEDANDTHVYDEHSVVALLVNNITGADKHIAPFAQAKLYDGDS